MKNTPLHWAVLKNKKIIVKTILEESKQKVDLSLKDNDGLTVIHYAAKNNFVDILKILINYDGSKSLLEEVSNNGIFIHLIFMKMHYIWL